MSHKSFLASLISAVVAANTESSKELLFTAPVYADCTGDGTIGFLAGADYMIGREGRNEFNEPTAPVVKDKMTMGSSAPSATGMMTNSYKIRYLTSVSHFIVYDYTKNEIISCGQIHNQSNSFKSVGINILRRTPFW